MAHIFLPSLKTLSKLKCSRCEQDPFNIKDFVAQNVISCLPEG